MALAPKGMCECSCHHPPSRQHTVPCCERSGLMNSPATVRRWNRPTVMWLDMSSGGMQECQVCGKFQYPVIHSCSGVPRTDAAIRRWEGTTDEDKEGSED